MNSRYEYIVEKDYARVVIHSVRKRTDAKEILIDNDKLELIKTVQLTFKKYGSRYIAQYYKSDMVKKNLTRLIFGDDDKKVFITFKNQNEFDFRKDNLIASTQGIVGQNRKTNQKNNTSGVRGVTWSEERQKWRGQVHHKGKHYQILDSIDKELVEQAVIAKRQELLEFSFSDK